MDLLTHVVIVECDENQHKSYIPECENRRKMELFRDVGFRPVVFVRFNPDGYRGGNGGCFRKELDKNGENVLVVVARMESACEGVGEGGGCAHGRDSRERGD